MDTLEGLLFEEGYRFDFFQAVRLLERIYPDREPVGRDANPIREVVRFRAHLSLSFPASAIHEISEPAKEGGGPARMTVAFMGLTGPLAVLPRHYTELAIERVRKKDRALVDFLDLFHHRLLSLFHRAWEKYRFPIAVERALTRPKARGSADRFSLYLCSFAGMGTPGLRGRDETADRAALHYAGLIAQQPRSASALEGVLADHFGVPVKLEPFSGRWLGLSTENRTRLGGRPGEGNNSLGVDAMAGSRAWDQQAGFRVRVGPLSLARFAHFLPSGSAFRPLVQLTRFFAGEPFDFDVQPVLRAAEVPPCRLGETGPRAPRLGWTTWLETAERKRDADDAVFGGRLTRQGAVPD